MLEIKESSFEGAGLGVFAIENIPSGTHLTNYYGLVFEPYIAAHNIQGLMTSSLTEDYDEMYWYLMHMIYGVICCKGKAIYLGYNYDDLKMEFGPVEGMDERSSSRPNHPPSQEELLQNCGSLINDYYTDGDNYPSQEEQDKHKYKWNCEFNYHESGVGKMTSIKDIKKGEELTWDYGAGYWSHMDAVNPEHIQKVKSSYKEGKLEEYLMECYRKDTQ